MTVWGEQLVTTTEAAQLAQRTTVTIRQWVARGHLQPAGRAGRERLYRVREVLLVERDARRRDRRTQRGAAP